MKLSCYVYYRVLPGHVAQASAAARETILAMQTATGANARLMTKVDEPLLWMEVYDDIGEQDTFLSTMRQSLQNSGLGRWLADGGKRHTEVFQCA